VDDHAAPVAIIAHAADHDSSRHGPLLELENYELAAPANVAMPLAIVELGDFLLDGGNDADQVPLIGCECVAHGVSGISGAQLEVAVGVEYLAPDDFTRGWEFMAQVAQDNAGEGHAYFGKRGFWHRKLTEWGV
jgi:hypothetical protein